MQRKKTSSFAIVDNETLDQDGLFKKINIIDLIKNLERKAHVASVGIATSLQQTFEFMSPNICAQGNCPLQQAAQNAFRIAEGEACIHLTSAMPQ